MAKINGKTLIQSKSFWFNILSLLVMVAGLFGFNEFQPDPKVIEGFGTFVTIGNILLRYVTSKPITKII